MSNFRWFTDDKTEVIRAAKAVLRAADGELHDYAEHHAEHHADRSGHGDQLPETDEYIRLNSAACDAARQLRDVRGW